MVKSKVSYYFNILSSLQLDRTLKLVWALEPRRTIFVIVMMMASTGLLFVSLMTLKELIDVVSRFEVGSEGYKTKIITQVLIAGGAMVSHAVVNSLSAYFSEV